jgi:hypothetical protein
MNGATLLWRYTISSNTTWWLSHQVTRYPTSKIHQSGLQGLARIDWLVRRLPTTCEGDTPEVEIKPYKGYVRNARVIDVSMPQNSDTSPAAPRAGMPSEF